MECFLEGFVPGFEVQNFRTRLKALCGVHAETTPLDRRETLYTCANCPNAHVVKRSLRLRRTHRGGEAGESWDMIYQGNYTRDDAVGTELALATPSRQFIVASASENVESFIEQLGFERVYEYHQQGQETRTVDGMVIEMFRLHALEEGHRGDVLLPEEALSTGVLGKEYPLMVVLRRRIPANVKIARRLSLRLRDLAKGLLPHFIEVKPEDTLGTVLDDDYDEDDEDEGMEVEGDDEDADEL